MRADATRWRRFFRRRPRSTSSMRSTKRRRKAAGKEKGVLVVAVDGGCPGVKSVKQGAIGATAQQYPLLMASKGVEAVAEFLKTGQKPESLDTGEQLVTDHPVTGVPSINT